MKTDKPDAADSQPIDSRRGRRVAAVVLLTVAGFALLAPHVTWSWRGGLLLPMGVVFLIWAALVRSPGLMVPGGVLSGLGVGLALAPGFGPAALLFGLAGGFLLVGALNRLVLGRRFALWPLWPAAGLTLAGVVVLTARDHREVWRVAGEYWPYAAISVALWLLLAPARRSS
jgi:hypothetical protein